MDNLRAIARDLLANGTVEAVIGYEQGTTPFHTRPCIVRSADDADRLVFSHHAINNLASWVTRAKRPGRGKVAIVAKGCDTRALTLLIQEKQVDRESLYIIGMQCNGVVRAAGLPWNADTMADKCLICQRRTPGMADVLVGELEELPSRPPAMMERIQKIESLSSHERFDYWEEEFARCIRCYACRQACPLCYCEQCIAEKSVPQWIETSATHRGNFAWNVIRAFHLAGRCIGCNECERACPADIPLSLLNAKMAIAAREEFNYVSGMDVDAPTLVGSYDQADREAFIK